MTQQAKETVAKATEPKTPYSVAIAYHNKQTDADGLLTAYAKIMLEHLYAKREGYLAGYEAGYEAGLEQSTEGKVGIRP